MKEEFLAKVRRAIHEGPLQAEKTREMKGGEGRLVDRHASREAKAALFKERAASSGATVHEVRNAEALRARLRDLLPEPCRVALGSGRGIEPVLGGPLSAFVPDHCTVIPEADLNRETLFTLDAALTGAAFAVAETGSIGLETGADGAALASLTAPAHLVVLPESAIAADLLDLEERIGRGSVGPRASGFTLITGPSKTADIEMNLVVGVHGPKTLRLILFPG